MTDAAEIRKLEQVIWNLHKAKATHRESVPVLEEFQDQVVWDGVVEVFDLAGHPKTGMAYAWSHESDSGGRRYVTVLHLPPVDSPKKAVQASIIAESKQRII
jgi:hypothetical protein